jgi:chromosome segregation ATPase
MAEPNLTETAQEVAKLGGSAAGGAGIWLLLSKLLGHRENSAILEALQQLQKSVAAVNEKLAVFGATAATRAELEPLRTELALLRQTQESQAKTLEELQRRITEVSEGGVLR